MIQSDVDRLINAVASADNPTPRVYLTQKLWEQFLKEVLPVYEARYGGIRVDTKAFEEGHLSVLYRGCAVCLKQENKGKCPDETIELRKEDIIQERDLKLVYSKPGNVERTITYDKAQDVLNRGVIQSELDRLAECARADTVSIVQGWYSESEAIKIQTEEGLMPEPKSPKPKV